MYSFFVADADESGEIRDAIRQIGPDAEDRIMPTVAEKWISEAEARGRVEGRVEGRVGGIRQLVRNLLRLKFGPLDSETEARIEAERLEPVLERWSERMLTARTLAEVFDEG